MRPTNRNEVIAHVERLLGPDGSGVLAASVITVLWRQGVPWKDADLVIADMTESQWNNLLDMATAEMEAKRCAP